MGSNIEMKRLDNRVYLSSPTMHGLEVDYMMEAYNTNWMSSLGENIDEVERLIAQETETDFAVAVSSGTSALHIAVKLSGITKGTKVFCSDLTFVASVNPIVYEGGVPIFVDSEEDTWNMDPQALKKAFELHPDVRHVMIVNLFGVPGKIDEIREICKEHNAIIIEDAAESLGATYKGKKTGSFGQYGAISFNGNKIITGSSGGVLVTNNKEDAVKARKISTQNRENALWYQFVDIGYNYRMSNVIAGVVRGQIAYLEEHIARKKEIYYRYKKGFEGLPVSMNPFDSKNSEPNYWLSCMLIDKEAMCQQNISETQVSYIKEKGKTSPFEVLDALEACNIESRPVWKPMHMQPLFSDKDFISLGSSVGTDIFERGLCLPSDIKMTEEQQDLVIEIVRRCFD